ncbi:MAG: hypothetical protein IBX57_00210 [Gammaproteobacteria bacterium]|nr:hypothetical protein [Gammaproteobacteria bacterium]
MKVKDVIDFYEGLLGSMGVEADENGLLSNVLNSDTKLPFTVEGKRLALPTREVLRNADWDNYMAFHPLSENVYRGESKIIKALRAATVFRITSVISVLLIELTELAANQNKHKKLTPRQSELLSCFDKPDKRTLVDFAKITDAISFPGTERRLCSLYIKRGGKLSGEGYSRVAIMSFPITDEFDNDDRSIFGVKLRVKDFNSFVKLFNYILPYAGSNEEYSYGSNSKEAPYFDSLVRSFLKVAVAVNDKTELFYDFLDAPDSITIDTSWEDGLENISIFRDLIPALSGNSGDPGVEEQESANENTAAESTRRLTPEVPTPPPQQQPYQQPYPPQQGGQPGYGMVQQPMQHPQQGGYHQPQQQQTPPWEEEAAEGSVSFSEMMAKKFGSQPTPPPPPQQPYYQQPMPNVAPYPGYQQPMQYPQQPMQGYGQPYPPRYQGI